VDVGKAGDIITAVHDLWSLPLQILIAFILLYLQVNVGFLAGVVIILVMIPLNRVIAVKIGAATKELMVHKDARVKLITECFRSIKSIKMSGLEDTMAERSMDHRDKELKHGECGCGCVFDRIYRMFRSYRIGFRFKYSMLALHAEGPGAKVDEQSDLAACGLQVVD
jgi:ABC-type protease/lipase transport system fused ATPase/permease subunit